MLLVCRCGCHTNVTPPTDEQFVGVYSLVRFAASHAHSPMSSSALHAELRCQILCLQLLRSSHCAISAVTILQHMCKSRPCACICTISMLQQLFSRQCSTSRNTVTSQLHSHSSDVCFCLAHLSRVLGCILKARVEIDYSAHFHRALLSAKSYEHLS